MSTATPDNPSDPTNTDRAFSVCIPVYNGRRFLAETLASIRAQTHAHWELIVAEDASPEPSQDIVEAFAASVPQRVIYVAATKNGGAAAARDLAINQATNPLLAHLDADDLWRPDHLAVLAHCFERTGAEFAFSSFSQFCDDDDGPPQIFGPSPDAQKDLRTSYFFNRYWLQPSMVAFQRTLLNKTGPWARNIIQKPAWLPNRNLAEDRNFFMRVIFEDARIAWTGHVTADYRKHPYSSTSFAPSGMIDRVWYYNFYGLLPGLDPQVQKPFLAYLNRAAGDQLRPTDPRHAAWFYFRAWRWYPRRIDRLARAFLSFAHALFKRTETVA